MRVVGGFWLMACAAEGPEPLECVDFDTYAEAWAAVTCAQDVLCPEFGERPDCVDGMLAVAEYTRERMATWCPSLEYDPCTAGQVLDAMRTSPTACRTVEGSVAEFERAWGVTCEQYGYGG